MSTITYTYEVVSVDETSRCMEIMYSSEGNPTLRIGARLPYAEETLEAVIQMYAPLRYWEELKTPLKPVTLGTSGDFVVREPIPPTEADNALLIRNIKLAETDWTQLPDVPLSLEQKTAWAVYRQALRDIPAQPGFPSNIDWHDVPNFKVTVL